MLGALPCSCHLAACSHSPLVGDGAGALPHLCHFVACLPLFVSPCCVLTPVHVALLCGTIVAWCCGCPVVTCCYCHLSLWLWLSPIIVVPTCCGGCGCHLLCCCQVVSLCCCHVTASNMAPQMCIRERGGRRWRTRLLWTATTLCFVTIR